MLAATKQPKKISLKKAAKLAEHVLDQETPEEFLEVPPMTQDEWDQCLKRLCCPSAADAVRWSEFAKVNRTNAEILDRLATLWQKPVTVDSGRLAGYAVTSVAIGHPLVWMDQTHDKGTPALSGDELADAVRGLWKIKNADSPALESFDEVLTLSLSLHPPLEKLKTTGATDAELLTEIKAAWRSSDYQTVRGYKTSIDDPNWGCAIWIEGFNSPWPKQPTDLGAPYAYADGTHTGLLTKVRACLGIDKPSAKKSKTSKQAETETQEQPANPFCDDEPAELGSIVRYAVGLMTRSPYQTRQDDPAQIDDLAESMRTEGQLDPILVRPNGELIGGHTRWQAAQKLGWKELDARVVTCSDATARRLVLIHNAKRKDLTERERVKSYLDLLEDYKSRGQSQEELAKRLGIKGPTLSNILRLRVIPEELWQRFEKGWLSIDQLRALATHAARQKFVDGVLKHLESIEGQPEPSHFKSAMQAGIERCFRPMTPPIYRGGPGCLFKPNKIESELLEIVEVESPWGHGKEKMAANVDEWNRMQKAAKVAAKLNQADTSGDPKEMKAVQRLATERRLQRREQCLKDAWHDARGTAIAVRFAKPKKQDHLAAMRMRILIAQHTGAWGDFHLDVDALAVDDVQFVGTVCEDVRAFFAESPERDDIPQDDLAYLCTWMNLQPANYWKATTDLLATCTSEELETIASDFDLPPNQIANDLVEVLVNQWPFGLIPPLFREEEQKAKAKPKKK